jgi:Ni/Co efflux regulator RcnB
MNLISTLKTLPLIGVLAMGLALSPITAIADKGERSHSSKGHKSYNSTFRSSHHNDRHSKHQKRHDGHKYRHNDRKYAHHNKRHNKHVYNNHHVRGHGYQPRRYYTHNNYYAYDRGYYDRHDVFDNIEFMFGLHTGNFDIIFRD